MLLSLGLDSLKSAYPSVSRRRSRNGNSRQLRDVRLAFETLEVRSLLSGTPLTATGGFTFGAIAGTLSADQTVATFTDPGGAQAVASYLADIDWGDGSSTSPGTISFSDNVFTVSGSHLYAEHGSYNVVTTISETTGGQGGDAWATRAVMPTPRWASSAGAIDGVIYVAGGYNGSHLQTVQAYDTATNTWLNKNNKPAVQTNAAYGVINGVLYTAGGTNNAVEISSLYAYHPTTDTWTARAAVPGVARQNSGGAVEGDLLYVMGGFSLGNPTNHNYAYNPASNSWSAALAPLPTARTGLAVAAVDGTLYAIGGLVAGGGMTAAVEAYDPVSNTWTTKAAMPTAREDFDVAVVNGIIYVIGGTNLTTQFATVEAYDPATNAWTTLTSMPTARIALETVAVNDVIYAIGGYNGFPGSVALGTNESLTLAGSSVSATSSAIVTQPNQPPVANAFSPYTVNEGGSVTLDGSHSSDPEQDSALLTYLWDLDGDGLFGESGFDAQRGDETGMFPVFSAAGLDGPSTYSVQLKVIDDGNLSSNDVALLSITNEAPQANFSDDGPVNLVGPATVRFDHPSDLSPADADAGFRYAFALDADSLALATYENSSPDAEATFSFADGLFDHTIYGRILDKDGGASDYSTVVHSWLLTPPVATAGVPTGLIEVFRFTDDGSTHAGTIEWGDGAVSPVSTDDGSITQNPDGSLSVWGSHTYLAAATGLHFSVGGTGDEDRYTAVIDVAALIAVNTPPVANDDSVAAIGTTVTLNVLANDTDANGDSLVVIGITQGTGGTAVINADGTLTYTVQYFFSAVQTFSYTVSDGQGGTATATVTVQVSADAGLTALASQIAGLGLNGGNTNSLLAKLTAAQNSLASGNQNAAINQLNAFDNAVAALVRSGRLSAAAADLLSLQIQTVLAGIGPG